MADERWTVDRLEGEWAVIERADGSTFNLPLEVLPKNVAEGDVLQVTTSATDDQAQVTIVRDVGATVRLRGDLRKQVDELRARDPGGDVKL